MWKDVLNALLAGIAVISLLWALRLRSVLGRVSKAIEDLKLGRWSGPLRQSNADREPIFGLFDDFVETSRRREPAPPTTVQFQDISQLIHKLTETLKPAMHQLKNGCDLLALPQVNQDEILVSACVNQVQQQLSVLEQLLDTTKSTKLDRMNLLSNGDLGRVPALAKSAGLFLGPSGATYGYLRQLFLEHRTLFFSADDETSADTIVRSSMIKVLFIDAGDEAGIGWQLLAKLRRAGVVRGVPTILYHREKESQRARLWMPTEIWFWPTPMPLEDFVRQWKQTPGPLYFSTHGLVPLAIEVANTLGDLGLSVTGDSPEPAIALDPCATLLVLTDSEELPADKELAQYLIIPDTTAFEAPAELSFSFRDSAWIKDVEDANVLSPLTRKLETIFGWDLSKPTPSTSPVESIP